MEVFKDLFSLNYEKKGLQCVRDSWIKKNLIISSSSNDCTFLYF